MQDQTKNDAENAEPVYDKAFYLELFSQVHDHVAKNFRTLFNKREIERLDAFSNAPLDSKRLFARLFLRKHVFIRGDSISYPEISDLNKAIIDLVQIDYASSEVHDLEEGLHTLSAPELKKISLKGTKGGKKEAIASILKETKGMRSVFGGSNFEPKLKQVRKLLGSVIKLDSVVLELIQRSHSAYFCFTSSQESTMKDVLLSFFGLRKFPKYEIDLNPVWRDRESLLLYHSGMEIENGVHILLAEKKWEEVVTISRDILPNWNFEVSLHALAQQEWIRNKFSHLRIWTRILSACSSAFGRLKYYTEEDELLKALLDQDIFSREKRGKLWERRCLLAERYLGDVKEDRPAECKEMCILAITDRNVLGGAAKAIIERLARVVKDIEMDDVLSTCKRLDLVEGTIAVEIPSETITRTKIQSKRGGAGGKSSWVSGVSDEDGKTRAVNVEDITLEHFNELGWKGFHCEGSALTTLYGLLFFDIIFSNVPGVFKNAYQTAPLDYGSESFYSNRKKSIDDRLVMIESEFDKTLEMIRECWTENHKVQCVGVNWELCELDEIICIAKGLGTNLSKILGVMAKFVKRRSGLPDLLLYREEEDGAVVVKMVEVKGPGDSLMSHQSVWIGLLLEMGVDVSVCKVVEAGGGSESGKRKRKEMEG